MLLNYFYGQMLVFISLQWMAEDHNINLTVIKWLFVVVLMCFLPNKLGIDTKIMKFELLFTELWSFNCFGGHRGHHPEKSTFQGVKLW